LLDGALRIARPGAAKQVRLNPDELEMRDLFGQIKLDVPVAPEPIDTECKTERASEDATHWNWALIEIVWQCDKSRPVTFS